VNKWIIGPFGSLKYAYLNEDGFTETGAGSLNLKVDRRKTDSLVSELGFRVARPFKTNSGNMIPELTAALNYDFDIDDRVITASFSGSPDATFSMKGQKVERYGATVGVGLTFIHDKGFSTTLKYSGEFREKYQSHGVMGQLRFSF
jgi:outer membrane autotransporter protein